MREARDVVQPHVGEFPGDPVEHLRPLAVQRRRRLHAFEEDIEAAGLPAQAPGVLIERVEEARLVADQLGQLAVRR